ncbi:hypothetical protein M3P05_20370 [Sansalvadorimonas sp. 2012CJ34-2]|uniref:Uncharacterized protein n=1 Tax=Parendozoicomonas callyspongiae TaxID=2942213 RepID=A0ABT0PLL7_9GAMM|nr:hypothetical protein [Sansalvadorimonas sp. 2012CJ34-2]MCL6272277.1 hypothetical protein [Sansalvadorimonas sp. 2012CJ34-2]
MIATKARKLFKKRFGNANHLLITSLIGLDALEKSGIKNVPDIFSTSWNPKNTKNSINRSRIFILQSFLGSAVESLEMYMTELNRKPKELKSERFTTLFSQANQSIYKKITLIGDELQIDPVLISLMEVLITWRNYSFHYDIDNEIRDQSSGILRSERDRIKNEYCGLDSVLLGEKWKKHIDFTFKEAASLISATHKFVQAVDEYIVNNIDLEQYAYDSISNMTKEKKFCQKIYSLPDEKKRRYLQNIINDKIGVPSISNDVLDSILNRIQSSHVTDS